MDFISGLLNKPTVDIIINEVSGRKRFSLRGKNGESQKLPTFYDREDVTGKVILNLNKLKKLEHLGIKFELTGLIEQLNDKKNVSRFITITRDLEPGGIITNEITNLSFEFKNVEKPYETYRGNNVIVKYTLKVTVLSKMRQVSQETEFAVINPRDINMLSTENVPIKLEVGIEDWLHLFFEVYRNKFHLRDNIAGQVTFKKVSIRLKSMELQIIKKETIGADENIPIKIFLSPYELGPTYSNINNRFCVQYFINLVLMDVEDRKYFKQTEIKMVRVDKKYKANQNYFAL